MTRLLQMMAGARLGGAEGFFTRLAPALQRAGVTQKVLIRRNADRAGEMRNEGVDVTELPFGGLMDMVTPWQVRRIARDFAPEVTLTWMNRASRLTPAGPHVKVARLGGYYDLKYYRRCDHLVGNTKDLRDYVIDQGWPAERAWYLPNFVDNLRLPPVDREAMGTPKEAPLVLGLGRLHGNKGFDAGLEAIAQLPGVHYWIAGEGPLRQQLLDQARQLGITDRVRFLGWRTDVAALFGAADIFLCSSRHEPLGNMVIEAWAQGTPVVAAASQGPTQLIRDGENGLLGAIDDADAMARGIRSLLDDPAHAVDLATRAAEDYQAEFTEARVVEKYLEFFDKVTG